MRKESIVFSFIILLIISMLACNNEDYSRLQASWTSKDPISIPLNHRMHQLKLDNLVLNSSFESGKLFYEERNINSYDIYGWKEIGKNIEWVNTQNKNYKEFEVFKGIHSIKIHREIANETEETGEGIISDFIKVIPGNYSLKLFLKFENICPYKDRLGVKLYDAINIRLIYYDKNKIELEAKEFNPFTKKNIDNTFKSLSFANYWSIDSLDWSEVHAKTANFPYFDGDLPDQARYVKIFIGLKGTGTMWIDNIDFSYTDQNFTLLERLKPYFDSSFTAYDKILPVPKIIQKKEFFEYYNIENKKLPIIILPNKTDKHLIKLVETFRAKLQSVIQKTDSTAFNIQIAKDVDLNNIDDYSLIISVGKNPIYNQYKNSLPDTVLNDNIDSYYIKSYNKIDNLIFINGNNTKSLYNGLNTLNQLLDVNKPIYYSADIIDYPDFLQRSFLIHNKLKSDKELNKKLDLFSEYKLNIPYFEFSQKNHANYSYSDINNICNWRNGFNIMIKLNDLNSLLNKNNLSNKIKKSLKSIIISQDQTISYNNYYKQKQILPIENGIYETHDIENYKLLEKCINTLNKNNKLTSILFIPQYSSLELSDYSKGQSISYFDNLQTHVSTDLSIIWTGSGFCSNYIDYEEMNRMHILSGNYPILMDNSLLASTLRFESEYIQNYYAGKIRVLSFFEPYKANFYDNFYLDSRGRNIILNIDTLSECNSIRVLTAANYYWNTKGYQPDKTLWIILQNLYGRDAAINLLKFNDVVFGFKEICNEIEITGLNNKNTRIAKSFKNSLIKYYNLLTNDIKEHSILEEIGAIKIDVIEEYNNALLENK